MRPLVGAKERKVLRVEADCELEDVSALDSSPSVATAEKHIQFGNQISFSSRKSRRTWKPNVQTKRLHSEILDETIKVRVTAYAMRCIKKAGGLDPYILNKKYGKSSPFADSLREKMLEAREKLQEGETVSASG